MSSTASPAAASSTSSSGAPKYLENLRSTPKTEAPQSDDPLSQSINSLRRKVEALKRMGLKSENEELNRRVKELEKENRELRDKVEQYEKEMAELM
ncbi:hypothetical protein RUND412_008091 [Rhizina undulata]